MVVGAPNIPPSKKAAAAAKKLASAPALPNKAGVDPNLTVVAKKAVVQDESEGRPNKAIYDAEQEKLKAQIDVLQAKSNEIKARIAAVSGKGPNNERKIALRAELDSLRGDQAKIKGGRGKTLEQVKVLQDTLSKKIKDLQAAKSKASFKSVAEVDAHIKTVEKEVESGRMTLVNEKKALQEISTLKKTRKTVESFATAQSSIDDDKKKIDDIRAGMDDPEAKAISDKFNAAKSELDAINKAHDEASKGRDAIYDERNAVSKELDAVYTIKKESAAAFREANNKFYAKMTEDRAKRAERQQGERAAIEATKRAEVNERLLEAAQAPAFERDIEDCRTLIDFFQRRIGLPSTIGPISTGRFGITSSLNLPKLNDVRQVETGVPAGAVALKKKSEQEEEYFMGGGGGKKGKKGKRPEGEAAAAPAVQALNLPFGTLSALLTLGITSPIKTDEVPKTIEALEAKMAYFVSNQERTTKANIAAVEKKIAQADAKSKVSTNGAATPEVAAEAAKESAPAAVEEKKEEAEVVAEKEEEKTE